MMNATTAFITMFSLSRVISASCRYLLLAFSYVYLSPCIFENEEFNMSSSLFAHFLSFSFIPFHIVIVLNLSRDAHVTFTRRHRFRASFRTLSHRMSRRDYYVFRNIDSNTANSSVCRN